MGKKRIERIQYMEAILDRVSAAQAALRQALDAYQAEQDALRELTEWYESPQWRADFEADEAGLLPRELKRGVLSEDGIYEVLTEDTALRQGMAQLAGRCDHCDAGSKENESC